jgi:hypothetical protein
MHAYIHTYNRISRGQLRFYICIHIMHKTYITYIHTTESRGNSGAPTDAGSVSASRAAQSRPAPQIKQVMPAASNASKQVTSRTELQTAAYSSLSHMKHSAPSQLQSNPFAPKITPTQLKSSPLTPKSDATQLQASRLTPKSTPSQLQSSPFAPKSTSSSYSAPRVTQSLQQWSNSFAPKSTPTRVTQSIQRLSNSLTPKSTSATKRASPASSVVDDVATVMKRPKKERAAAAGLVEVIDLTGD